MRDKNDTDLLNERKFFSKQIEAIFAKTGSILSGDLRDSPHFRSYLKTGEFENPRANINEIFNEISDNSNKFTKKSKQKLFNLFSEVKVFAHKSCH